MIVVSDPPAEELPVDADGGDGMLLGSADGVPDRDGIALGATVGVAVGDTVIVMTTGAATTAAG